MALLSSKCMQGADAVHWTYLHLASYAIVASRGGGSTWASLGFAAANCTTGHCAPSDLMSDMTMAFAATAANVRSGGTVS